MRALVIGLDCVPPKLVFERWAEALPNLTKLCAEGAYGPLRSTSPPITVPAWACMASGKDPGEVGLYGFRNRKRDRSYELRVASSKDVKVKRLWDRVSNAGKRATSLFVPLTSPPSPLRGTMVSCFLTPPGAGWSFPPSKAKALTERFGEYHADVTDFRSEELERIFGELDSMREQHFAMAEAAWIEDRPDFMMMVEMGPDRLHHAAWHHMDPESPKYEAGNRWEARCLAYYQALDASVGSLVAQADEDTLVLVASDHGAKAMQGGVAMNDLLAQLGWLTLRDKKPGEGVTPLRDRVVWEKTRAWCEGGYYSRLFLNVAGREPAGVVPSAERESARDELIDAMTLALREHGVTLRAEIPEQSYAKTGGEPPDALLYLSELDYRALGTVGHLETGPSEAGDPSEEAGGTNLVVSTNDTGPDGCNHDWDGVIILHGPGVAPRKITGAHILDVAPTVLAHLGLDHSDLRGRDLRAPCH